MLAEGQVSVNGLVMGAGTQYRLLEFTPWSRTVRAEQGAARAWNHGGWSGAEWQDQAVVPMRIRVIGSDAGSWLALHQQLAAAFAPSHEDLELRWVTGGTEYLLRGRPRMVEPEIRTIGHGQVVTKAAWAALDPIIYSGLEHSAATGLPVTSGGLLVPVTAPMTVDATSVAGRVTITNAGTAPVPLRLRVDGPVSQPWVAVTSAAADPSTLRCWLDLDTGQWLDIDTGARTALLNGVVSRRGLVSGDWPLLAGGDADVAFNAPTYQATALLTVAWRDGWY
jgi:hypothetical protein